MDDPAEGLSLSALSSSFSGTMELLESSLAAAVVLRAARGDEDEAGTVVGGARLLQLSDESAVPLRCC